MKKIDDLFNRYQPIKGDDKKKEQVWEQMIKEKSGRTKLKMPIKYVVAVISVGLIFLVLNIGIFNGEPRIAEQPNPIPTQPEKNEPTNQDEASLQIITLQEEGENWRVEAISYEKRTFMESEFHSIDSSLITLTYIGDNIETIENFRLNFNNSLDWSDELLADRKISTSFSTPLVEGRSYTITVEWNGEEEVLTVPASVETEERFEITNPITVADLTFEMEGESDQLGITQTERFQLVSSFMNWKSAEWSYGADAENGAVLYVDPVDYSQEIEILIGEINESSQVIIEATHESGEKIELINEQFSKSDAESIGMKNTFSFSKLGSWALTLQINGDPIETIGLEIIPRYSNMN